ncbi:zinc metallochaperone AztD [Dietzia sp. PP-33]|jgi:outer membrane protein assembly factor BamB|uniref:zinc metallochaperone AztD n=1 Tax=Dietzia sp. PP-33 TaxID=2957500 RepID=UPI0029B758FF|nr:zinc metallochaperone AztD [Dietzia sp. PP-33]MDX2358370.1 zinc metallochaperone AztD [Dietzia sp. PP-33]
MRTRHTRAAGAVAMLATAALLATACSNGGGDADADDAEAQNTATTSSAASEAGSSENRLAVAYENGIAVLDGETLEVIEEFETEEFTRLNAFGDGQTVLVTTSDGFQVLDTSAPELTDLVIEAETPAHVVRHADKTVLYDDGTSDTFIFDTAALAEADGELPEFETIPGDQAHHGVSIVLEDGTFLTTIGDDEGRTGAYAVDADGEEIARNEECPGVHGEGTAAGETVIFGCEDGALIYQDGEFEKITAADEYGRMGNAYVSEDSPLVVGDYKDDPDAESVLLTKIALIDTEDRTHEVVDLPEGVGYTWRDVVRGPNDMAYLLGTDGAIHVIDPATGEISESYDVIDPWEGPAEWQDAHPSIVVNGDIAYVSEPAKDTVYAVDLATGEVVASGETPGAPNEMAVALG